MCELQCHDCDGSRIPTIFFVTTNLDPGAANLAPAERDIVLDWLAKVRVHHQLLLLGYVVMPDHAHVLLAVILGSLREIMHEWKSNTAHVIQRARGKTGSLWQARYFDFICRRARDVSNKNNWNTSTTTLCKRGW